MCKGTSTKARSSPRFLLTSLESYSIGSGKGPLPIEMITTCLSVVLMLVAVEFGLNRIFENIQDFHPLFEDATNRAILARHIGVDAFSCFFVAILGWSSINQDMVDAVWHRKNSMPVAFENRVFKYYPEGVRLTLFFFGYQLKNTYDTIIWNDGPEFIAHHILTLATAWGALYPGTCHYYSTFYFGVSEISTGVLCLLANFDDVHGVKGLAEAFPLVKMVIGGIFAVLFVICRVLMWSTVSYYYCRDAWNALKSNDPRLQGRRTWLRYTFVSLALLSLLQIIWLGEIVRIGREEMIKSGFL
eukprot:CAMPEP_0176026978 /NCGR_PEP_ID=MMETSP0120_2-20121206/13225_1 /TAXON_ID=160619 /ORGANISM="Kryptoperidinium foliaceum, Strain CCMP 1326" /LENGTH=300 /DNA_ID=CAMNT_0017360183 /DNA_START=159 /DNA_END=1061 /DNA_ORIENTATION=-